MQRSTRWIVPALLLLASCGGPLEQPAELQAPAQLDAKADLPAWIKAVVQPVGCSRQVQGGFKGLASAHLYRMRAVEQTSYRLVFNASYPASRGAGIAVYDEHGARLASVRETSSASAVLDFSAPSTGDYLLLVGSATWFATGSYELAVECQLPGFSVQTPAALGNLLVDPAVQSYAGAGDGGVSHVTYWTIDKTSDEFDALGAAEKNKVVKVQANQLHSALFVPQQEVPGVEATGQLVINDGAVERRQQVVLQVPSPWNGRLLVGGTPGLRNEYANQVVFAQWALERGYAFVSGDKGLPTGAAMLGGDHPTQHWGMMMIDLAVWAGARLAEATGQPVLATYAVGLSNGGYQTRRALELDHQRAAAGAPRLFAGGLDWSGTYWPDARVLDGDGDGVVSPAEFAARDALFRNSDAAALIMGWPYDPAGHTRPEEFATTPPYAAVQSQMQAAGYTEQSALYWGLYNTIYDGLKTVAPIYRGVGYYNLISYLYRAELRGDQAEAAAAYSCYADPQQPDARPPLYDWLATAFAGGWDATSVEWALKNANTAEFSAPLISLHGDADALLPLPSHGTAYASAVAAYGTPGLHRLYVVAAGSHVDQLADGIADFDFDGIAGNEQAADRATPMQAHVMRAFGYLTAWAEEELAAPASKTIATDPLNDLGPDDVDGLFW